MANPARARQAFHAWQEHLITEGEALEVAGAEDKAALLAAAGLKRGNPTAMRPVAFRSDRPARDPRPSRT